MSIANVRKDSAFEHVLNIWVSCIIYGEVVSNHRVVTLKMMIILADCSQIYFSSQSYKIFDLVELTPSKIKNVKIHLLKYRSGK